MPSPRIVQVAKDEWRVLVPVPEALSVPDVERETDYRDITWTSVLSTRNLDDAVSYCGRRGWPMAVEELEEGEDA